VILITAPVRTANPHEDVRKSHGTGDAAVSARDGAALRWTLARVSLNASSLMFHSRAQPPRVELSPATDPDDSPAAVGSRRMRALDS
jgi:hypothetical protein